MKRDTFLFMTSKYVLIYEVDKTIQIVVGFFSYENDLASLLFHIEGRITERVQSQKS